MLTASILTDPNSRAVPDHSHGGTNHGDPYEAEAYHGFAGRDEEVVDKIAKWILQ